MWGVEGEKRGKEVAAIRINENFFIFNFAIGRTYKITVVGELKEIRKKKLRGFCVCEKVENGLERDRWDT